MCSTVGIPTAGNSCFDWSFIIEVSMFVFDPSIRKASYRVTPDLRPKEEYRNRNINRFTTQAIKTLQEKLCGLLKPNASREIVWSVDSQRKRLKVAKEQSYRFTTQAIIDGQRTVQKQKQIHNASN